MSYCFTHVVIGNELLSLLPEVRLSALDPPPPDFIGESPPSPARKPYGEPAPWLDWPSMVEKRKEGAEKRVNAEVKKRKREAGDDGKEEGNKKREGKGKKGENEGVEEMEEMMEVGGEMEEMEEMEEMGEEKG